MNVKKIAGHRFGRLVALEPTENRNRGNIVWKCQCDCGNIFFTTCCSLTSNRTLSCGCLRREKASKNAKNGNNRRTHNQSKSLIYDVWGSMKRRCFSINSKAYKNYGGRGITVCEEWKNNFQSFYDYVSKLPHYGEKGYSLDRINNDGNYEPGNVRWATRSEQNLNRRKRINNGVTNKTDRVP